MNSEDITTDANNLYISSLKVRKSSPNKVATMRFMQNQITDIGRAQEELHNRIWKIEQMKPFIISERGHIRKIQGNTPYDRMIIHSYIDYCLEPLLSKYMIYDNYAGQAFMTLGIIIGVIAVIALVAFIIYRLTHPKLKADDKPEEKQIVEEELNRILKPIDDDDVAQQVNEYEDKKDE